MPSLEQLKAKYEPVLRVIGEQGAQLKNLHIQEDKLFMRAAAPTEEAKGYIWTAIKEVDRANDDLLADITVDSSLPAPKQNESYTVKSGDTLSAIARTFKTTIGALKSWNGLSGTRIAAGHTLTIYAAP